MVFVSIKKNIYVVYIHFIYVYTIHFSRSLLTRFAWHTLLSWNLMKFTKKNTNDSKTIQFSLSMNSFFCCHNWLIRWLKMKKTQKWFFFRGTWLFHWVRTITTGAICILLETDMRTRRILKLLNTCHACSCVHEWKLME